MNKKPKKTDKDREPIEWIFCKQYINRWGQLMVAANYGYEYWRFPVKRSNRG